MDDNTARAIDDARGLTAWEYLAEPTPERIGYAMACYVDGLIQQGHSPAEIRQTAPQEAAAAIFAALDAIEGKNTTWRRRGA